MAFCWQADDGPTLNAGLIALRVLGHVSAAGLITFWKEPSPLPQKKKRKGIRTSIANEPYFYCNFPGKAGGPDPLPPLWIRSMVAQHWMLDWKICDFNGIRTSIAKLLRNPIFFCNFPGGGGPDPLSPSRSAHTGYRILTNKLEKKHCGVSY